MQNNNHLLLIDGLNLVRRIYGANPAPDSREKAEGAINASRSSFRRALADHKPTHCLWTFDHPSPTWRHDLYSEYKINRKPMAEELRVELDGFCEELALLGWAEATFPGFEAEDTIASATRLAIAAGARVTVLSNDKDTLCLMGEGAVVHDHFARESRNEAYCEAKFGVPSNQLLEVLALWGDAVDGVPGVDKVGVTTAAKLVREFGPVAAVLEAAAANKIPGKLGIRLREQAERARLSRALVELRFDVYTAVGRQFSLDSLTLGAS